MPGALSETKRSVREYLRLLARYLASDRQLLLALTVVLFSGIGVRLLAPWLAARFLDGVTGAAALADRASAQERLPVLVLLAALFCVAGIVDQALAVASTHIGAHISWRATNRLREDVVAHCLKLDVGFHHEHGPGVMVERVDGDIRELNNFFAEFAIKVLGNLLVIAGVLVVMLWVDWRVMLGLTGFALAALWVFSRVRGVASPYWLRARTADADLYGEVEERFGGLPDVRANGAEGYVNRRFAESLRNQFHRNRTALSVSVIVSYCAGSVMVLGSAAILAAAAALYLSGSLSIGTVFMMAMYTRIIVGPLEQIMGQIDDLQRAAAGIDRVYELLDTKPVVDSGPGANWSKGALAVAFENVSFGYSAAARAGTSVAAEQALPPVLHGVSFELRPGEVLGVIGRTGAGKSTIVRLLLRFYDPTAGRITLDGVDLRQARIDELRAHVGVVTQEVQLFHATVRDNLTLFDNERMSDEQLIGLLCELGLESWFERQPLGLDTVLAPAGGGMSAGEAQLLGVARVFVADPGAVILDEPTSQLDPATELSLERAFNRLFAGRTGVIVAHRLHTLNRADTILILDHGRVTEYGSRTELAQDPESAYHRALQRGLSLGPGEELYADASSLAVADPAARGGQGC